FVGDFGFVTRSISSHVCQPTSPTHTSSVPGRIVNRKGLRNPYATTRRAFWSGLDASGLSGSPAPVSGLTRRMVPSRPTGSPAVRRSCDRRAPPSADGGVIVPPTPPGGSPHGFVFGEPCCP